MNEIHFRPALEIHNRDHVRVIQTREFYSKNGIGLGRVFDLENLKSTISMLVTDKDVTKIRILSSTIMKISVERIQLMVDLMTSLLENTQIITFYIPIVIS